ncbi:lipid-binding SYLF domain-containing protein [Nitrospina watsonii]|uniref:Ysc84 domain-containing protein n=1 Tax=Nitrospina watsonii TaxID=1323948 RepID=A0ABM9HHY5_9BACT|nr:lipid-binding SYLF domain-containing protein [Nitrospina watsonii]CAI2719677.1 Ysc84 domain-containing protein [Nitrospina watsonii]
MKPILAALAAIIILSGLLAPGAQAELSVQQQILQDSQFVLEEIISAPDEGIPSKLMAKAKAIVIMPTMVKGGFFVGARYGSGVVSVRDASTGRWGPPAFLRTYGGSFGLQFGAQAVDLVLLVMSERGVNALLDNKFTLGGDLAVSVGPVGRYTEAGTDLRFQGEVYSYSRSKGAFAGVSVKGAYFQPNQHSTQQYYRTTLSTRQVLFYGSLARIPKSSAVFMENLNRLAPASPSVLTKLKRSHPVTTAEQKPKMQAQPKIPEPAPQEMKKKVPGKQELIQKSEAPGQTERPLRLPTPQPLW